MFSRANLPSIHTILIQLQLRWAGPVVRMSGHKLPKKLVYVELQNGKCPRGGQTKRFEDTLKASLKAFDITPASLERTVCDRSEWRLVVRNGAKSCEASRTASVEHRRQLRKSANRSPSAAYIPCVHYPRTFSAQIDLASHLRTHRKKMIHGPYRCDGKTRTFTVF